MKAALPSGRPFQLASSFISTTCLFYFIFLVYSYWPIHVKFYIFTRIKFPTVPLLNYIHLSVTTFRFFFKSLERRTACPLEISEILKSLFFVVLSLQFIVVIPSHKLLQNFKKGAPKFLKNCPKLLVAKSCLKVARLYPWRGLSLKRFNHLIFRKRLLKLQTQAT